MSSRSVRLSRSVQQAVEKTQATAHNTNYPHHHHHHPITPTATITASFSLRQHYQRWREIDRWLYLSSHPISFTAGKAQAPVAQRVGANLPAGTRLDRSAANWSSLNTRNRSEPNLRLSSALKDRNKAIDELSFET